MNGKCTLISIIRTVLNSEPVSDRLSAEELPELIKQAHRHNVEYLLYCWFQQLPEVGRPSGDFVSSLQAVALREIYKSENQMYAVTELQEQFEANGIYNIALKGVNTRQRYTDPLLRSMGDLDILYRPEQSQQLSHMMKKLGYDGFSEGRKHDHYHRKYIGVEMHRELVAASSEFSRYYADIWERCIPKPDRKYTYEMRLEDEYIYNFLHLIEHFKSGGIGIRFIMDIYVYEHLPNLDLDYVKTEFEKLGVLPFYENIRLLAERWFGAAPPIDAEKERLLEKLCDYVIRNGVYGNSENAAALAVAPKGRIGYFVKECFPNYGEMRSMFPWLAKCPLLLPYSWILRGMRSIKKRRNHISSQWKRAKKADLAKGKELRCFYRECGL